MIRTTARAPAVVQELKDRLRFSQLYAEAHPDAAPEAPSAVSQPWEQPEGPSEQSWQHGQRVQQQFREQHIEELRMQVASLQQSVQTRDQDVSRLREWAAQKEREALQAAARAGQADQVERHLQHLQQQLAEAVSKLSHSRQLQLDLAGALEESHEELAGARQAARLYNQAMDEVQRLRGENGVLRRMLQEAQVTGGSLPAPAGLDLLASPRAIVQGSGLSYVADPSPRTVPTVLHRIGGGYAPAELSEDGRHADLGPSIVPPTADASAEIADLRRHRQAGRGAWLPTRAVEALAQFVRRLSLDATWGDLQQLMMQVHKAYLAQMQVRLHALRQLYSRQQQALRRRAANAQPYVQVLYRQQVRHLRAQLEAAQASAAGGQGTRQGSAAARAALEKSLPLSRELDRVCAENEVLRHNMGVYIAEAQQAKRALQSSRRSLHSSTSAAEASAADASAVAVSAIPERPPSRHTAQRDMLAPVASQVASPHNQQPQPLTSASSADAGTAGAGLAGASGLEPQQQASATADGGSSQEGGVRHEAGLSAPAAPAAPAVRSEGSQTQPAQGSGRQATAGKKQPMQAAALQPSPSAQRLTFARPLPDALEQTYPGTTAHQPASAAHQEQLPRPAVWRHERPASLEVPREQLGALLQRVSTSCYQPMSAADEAVHRGVVLVAAPGTWTSQEAGDAGPSDA